MYNSIGCMVVVEIKDNEQLLGNQQGVQEVTGPGPL